MQVGLSDLLPHTAGVGQMLKGLAGPLASLPFLAGWGSGFKTLLVKALSLLRLAK